MTDQRASDRRQGIAKARRWLQFLRRGGQIMAHDPDCGLSTTEGGCTCVPRKYLVRAK